MTTSQQKTIYSMKFDEETEEIISVVKTAIIFILIFFIF